MKRALPLVALLTACALSLTGCAGGVEQASPAGTSPQPTTTAATDTGAPRVIPDPRTLTGPTTAVPAAEIKPANSNVEPKLPATVTDARGKQVKVSSVERILALDLYGSLTQTVAGLGLADRLVGRALVAPPELQDLPMVTKGGPNLDVEKIISLQPTVVLYDTTIGSQEARDQLAAAGLTLVEMPNERSIETIGARIQAIADALGVSDAGVTLAKSVGDDMADALTEITALTPAEPLRMLFVYVRGNAGLFFILASGEGTDGLINALGGNDVATGNGMSGIKPASPEALVGLNPDLILTMSGGLESSGGVTGLVSRPGVAETTAGTKQRIVDMAESQMLAFGPNYPDVLRSLAKAVYLGEGK